MRGQVGFRIRPFGTLGPRPIRRLAIGRNLMWRLDVAMGPAVISARVACRDTLLNGPAGNCGARDAMLGAT
jgi:hypothetical protein